jgi:hypothetical protein
MTRRVQSFDRLALFIQNPRTLISHETALGPNIAGVHLNWEKGPFSMVPKLEFGLWLGLLKTLLNRLKILVKAI